MKSALQEERIHYQPALPNILKGVKTLEAIRKQAVELPSEIQALFPHMAKQTQSLQLQMGMQGRAHNQMRIGVILSGGQAPGGHNVIAGLFDALKLLNEQNELIGFKNGPSGIIENQSIPITAELLENFRNTGGFDLIGSGRTKIETDEQFRAVANTARELQLNGLVVIGGDDSNTNAALLAEYFLTHDVRTKVIGVPKTIDGDLKNSQIETSFGFDTAVKIYSNLIGNIARDALSARKYSHFIKLMGRSASHVTLECALQTHPNMTLISEELKGEPLSKIVDQIADVIAKRAKAGKHYNVILIPEGLFEVVQIPEGIEGTYDSHGNLEVSHIETEKVLAQLVKEKLPAKVQEKFQPIYHFFGYEGRSGFPSNFDANYTYALGYNAAVLIELGYTGYMSQISHLTKRVEDWEAGGVPIVSLLHMEQRQGKTIPVIKKALVDLQSEPFQHFSSYRAKWALNDDYRFPGPTQYFGPPHLTNESTMTLRLEQNVPIPI